MRDQMGFDAVGGASSTEAQHTKNQQPHLRVTNGINEELNPLRQAPSRQLSTTDTVASQVAEAPRQLSASNSSTSEVAESAQGQREVDLGEKEHLKPNDASRAGQDTESAEDDYADEFEPDEPVADCTATRLPPHALYHNPLEGDESAEGCEDDSASGHMHPPADGPHVKTQLSVADESEYVKVQWSLDVSKDKPQEDEDEEGEEAGDQGRSTFSKMPSTPYPKKKSIFRVMADDLDLPEDKRMESADASTWVPPAHTQLRVPEVQGGPVKVQWSLDVSKEEPQEDKEEGNDQGKGSFSKMPSTPFPRKSIFSATPDDLDVEGEAEPVKVQWSLDVGKDEPQEDDEEEGSDQGKGRFSKMPSTPFPRKSILSMSGNMADDVDIFSATLPNEDSGSESAAESDIGVSLPRVSSDVRHGSTGESGVQLTPSYRQTQRHSLQQAADNEQPFATSWRPQPAPAQEADASKLVPTTTSQTPSRRSSLVPSQDTASEQGMQSSLSTAGMSVPAKPAGSNQAAAAEVPATLPSHASLPVQISLEKLAPGSLSRQPSCLTQPASGTSSRGSSFSARVDRETSQLLGSCQVNNAASVNAADYPQSEGVSRTASLSSGANTQLSPVLSSRVLAPQASEAESNRTASKRSSFSEPASLSQESSQISRQVSGGTASAAVAPASAASSGAASGQPLFSSSAVLNHTPSQVSRQQSMSGMAAAVVPSSAASLVALRHASLTHPPGAALSRQASYISRQPSSASSAAAVAAAETVALQPPVNRPASATRQNSQRQVSDDDVMVARTGPMVSPSGSRVPSRQQSLAARSPSGLPNAFAHDMQTAGQRSLESSSVSRTTSTSSQPRRSNSLEAMHQQMGMSRKATAVGSVAPAPVVRRVSNDKAGMPTLTC